MSVCVCLNLCCVCVCVCECVCVYCYYNHLLCIRVLQVRRVHKACQEFQDKLVCLVRLVDREIPARMVNPGNLAELGHQGNRSVMN